MTDTETVTGNGNLPPAREAIVEQAQRIHQEVAHDRDLLRERVRQLESDIAGYKVAMEAYAAQLAGADSRVATMTLVRDEAVGRAAALETILSSMLAIGRAFLIKNTPLIKTSDEEEVPTIGGA